MNPEYWEMRYASGRGPGEGSVGEAGQRKADQVNTELDKYDVGSVVDWGCGDGQITALLNLSERTYVGIDVSNTAIVSAMQANPEQAFVRMARRVSVTVRADASLSLDVIYHLVDDEEYRDYLRSVFESARDLVIAYATNHVDPLTARHVRFREWLNDVPRGWTVVTMPHDPTTPGLYVVERDA